METVTVQRVRRLATRRCGLSGKEVGIQQAGWAPPSNPWTTVEKCEKEARQ